MAKLPRLSDHYLAKLDDKILLKDARKFGTGSHITLSKKDIGDKYILIKISEEQYKKLKKKK